MELYVFENYRELVPELRGSPLTDRRIKEALKEYGVSDAEVFRTKKGKPYVKTGNDRRSEKVAETGIVQGGVNACSLCISVSHSGSYFVCLIDETPVGVDVQQERNAKADKIGRRYFTDQEVEYMNKEGDAGFFVLWTRKEAYSKYTGNGMEDILKGTSVIDREDVDFFDFQLEKGIYCSCCIKKVKDNN
ncbi:MAG: 4'-phosphopantetheinyl transferase superfamily protein [Clostridiales bacterium]|nr:4'-phosphopantetheinyl transferase superfamily protein [Clostridiales bacterium]